MRRRQTRNLDQQKPGRQRHALRRQRPAHGLLRRRWRPRRHPLEKNGEPTILADRYQEKRLTAPNDLCVGPERADYFTDPCYGRNRRTVRRSSPCIGSTPTKGARILNKVTRVIDDVTMPNGIAISQDEKTLYVADSSPDPKGPHCWLPMTS